MRKKVINPRMIRSRIFMCNSYKGGSYKSSSFTNPNWISSWFDQRYGLWYTNKYEPTKTSSFGFGYCFAWPGYLFLAPDSILSRVCRNLQSSLDKGIPWWAGQSGRLISQQTSENNLVIFSLLPLYSWSPNSAGVWSQILRPVEFRLQRTPTGDSAGQLAHPTWGRFKSVFAAWSMQQSG